MLYNQNFSNKSCFKVSEISNVLKQLIEENFFDVKIQGEVSGFKNSSIGHSYFNLKDEAAVINAVCWRGVLENSSIKIKDGMEVICSGKISTYPSRSNYQLIVNKIEIAGQGALLAAFEKRKKALTEEGLFDAIRKKSIPFLPECIGLITSRNAAVVRDILHRINDRFPLQVLIWDVLVQGNNAAMQICNAIDGFHHLPKHISKPDLIIIARGGGSIEDLWCFNEEEVVRAVVNSEIPIITAVGHETDFTLVDFAADLRAPTPTAAIELAIPVLNNLLDYITFFVAKISKTIFNTLEKNSLKTSHAGYKLIKLKNILKLKTQKLLEYQHKIDILMQNNLAKRHTSLSIMGQLLEKYDQKQILKRGFTIIHDSCSGSPITSSVALLEEMEVKLEMHDGYKTAMIKR